MWLFAEDADSGADSNVYANPDRNSYTDGYGYCYSDSGIHVDPVLYANPVLYADSILHSDTGSDSHSGQASLCTECKPTR